MKKLIHFLTQKHLLIFWFTPFNFQEVWFKDHKLDLFGRQFSTQKKQDMQLFSMQLKEQFCYWKVGIG